MAAVGGGAVVGLIIWNKRRGRQQVQMELQAPRFNEVAVGESDRQMVRITNLMGDPITIKEVALEGKAPSFSLTSSGRQVPFIVAPGERVEIGVSYTPSASGGSSARVRVVASSPRVQKDTVKVIGFSASTQKSDRRSPSAAAPVALDATGGAAAAPAR
jgi:hypothetical protein